MMKFKEFLIENEFKPPRPNKDLGDDLTSYIKRLDKSILQMIESDEEPPLYRGGVGTQPHIDLKIFVKSSINLKQPRKSANTSNEFTTLTSELLPSWKKFPKRNQSFVCTTDYSTAENYGDIYVVLPLDNPDIAVCPEEDIWYSFKQKEDRFIDLGPLEINNIFKKLNNILNKKDVNAYDTTEHNKTSLEKLILEIETKIANEELTLDQIKNEYRNSKHIELIEPEMTKFFNEVKKTGSIIKVLDSWIDPLKFDFELVKFKKLIDGQYSNREVWFSGEAIFVDFDHYPDFRMKIMGTKG